MSEILVDKISGKTGSTITIAAGQTLAIAGTLAASGTVTVTAGGIATAELADDAVTAAKLASNAVVTASIVDANVTLAKIENLAANTVLVRDASSSGVASAKAVATTQILIGDGTGFTAAALSGDVTMTNAGAVTIATDAVDIAMLSASGTASSSTFLRGDNAWVAAGDASVGTANEWTAQQNFNNTALTFDATQDWALTANQVATLTLTANTTFDAPTQMVDGSFYSLIIIQDGTGSRTASWNAVFKWAAGTAPTLTTTASAKDIFVWRSDGTNMYEVGRQLNVS